MSLSKGAIVLGMEIADARTELFVITERGYGKRTSVEEYTEHHRGGQGVTTIAMTDKKGLLAAMKVVKPGQELMIMSEEGVMIRVNVSDISQTGRATQGVKVMNVSDNDRVCAVARVATSKKKKKAGPVLEGQEKIFADGEVSGYSKVNGGEAGDADEVDDEMDALDELEGEEE
jgi:DNA gyrase subunit A